MKKVIILGQESDGKLLGKQCAIRNVICRALTDVKFHKGFLKDGDIVAQEYKTVSDYTGKENVELNRLLIQFDKRNGKWGVKCIDACVGYKNNFWTHIPIFTLLIGNVFDSPELLPSEVVFEPYI